MVAFDRSKFKVNVNEVDEVVKKAQKTMGRSGGAWVQFLTPEEGKNIYRVVPAFPPGKTYVPLKRAKLDCEVPVYDKDGNITGTKVEPKDVFCADIHGEHLLGGRCPIMSYIKYVKAKAEEIQDKEERKKFLYPITGYASKKGWVWGIEPMLSFVCYALAEDGEIYKLQLRPQWMTAMKKISIEQSEDEALSLDIFSDPDNGHPLCITKEKDEKTKKFVFSVDAVMPKKTQQWNDFFEENAISDATFAKLHELTSLSDSYVDVYRKKDWELALDGLQRFDEANGYGVFAEEEFLNELAEMAEMIPEDEEKAKEEEAPTSRPRTTERTSARTTAPAPTPEIKRPAAAAAAASASGYPSLIKLKAFLRDYIETEYEGTEVLPESLTLSELRTWYDLANEGKMLPFDDYREEEDNLPFDKGRQQQEETASPVQEPAVEASSSKEDQLAAARAKLAAFRRK